MGLRKERESVEDALAERAQRAHTTPNNEPRFITNGRGETVANPAYRVVGVIAPRPTVSELLDDLGTALR